MDYDVVEARHVSGYVVWLWLRDGTKARGDLRSEPAEPIFVSLHDPAKLVEFRVHPDSHTVTWPNGPDVAPETPHRRAHPAA